MMTHRKLLLAIFSALAIGALLGFAAPKPSHPNGGNTIIFHVLPTGKVYLAPVEGDHIFWKDESGTKPVKVHFAHQAPCKRGNDKADCIVTDSQSLAIYSCRDQSGQIVCGDPGVDPNSEGGDNRPQIAAGSMVSTNPPPAEVAALEIGCDDQGNTTVLDDKGQSNPSVHPEATVQWTAQGSNGKRMGFKISDIDPAAGCTADPAGSYGSGRIQSCKSMSNPGSVNYMVTLTNNACKNGAGPQKFSFKLQK